MLSEQGVSEFMHRHYGVNVQALQRVDGGAIHGIQKLTTSRGCLALKWYDVKTADEYRVRRSLRANEHARLWGIPVAAVVPTLNGDLSTKLEDGWYVVYPFIAGRTLSDGLFDEPSAQDLGRIIGDVQRAMCHFDASGLVGDYNWELTIQWGRSRLRERLRQAEQLQYPHPHVLIPALAKHIRLYEDHIQDMQGVTVPPRQWVHGDCNPGNFVFDDQGRVAAILDFDNVSFLMRGFDFMYAVDQSFRSDPRLLRLALRSYAEAAQVTEEEVVAYPQMWLFSMMLNVWPFDNMELAADVLAREWDHYHAQVNWWIQHTGDVTNIFRQVAADLP